MDPVWEELDRKIEAARAAKPQPSLVTLGEMTQLYEVAAGMCEFSEEQHNRFWDRVLRIVESSPSPADSGRAILAIEKGCRHAFAIASFKQMMPEAKELLSNPAEELPDLVDRFARALEAWPAARRGVLIERIADACEHIGELLREDDLNAYFKNLRTLVEQPDEG